MINSRRQRTGSLTVEMALCLPILLIVLFGCYELARANMLLHATESAAYEGARVGIIPGATADKIKAATGDVLRSVGIRDFKIDVKPGKIKRDTPQVEVTVEIKYADNTLMPSRFVGKMKFRGTCKLTREIP